VVVRQEHVPDVLGKRWSGWFLRDRHARREELAQRARRVLPSTHEQTDGAYERRQSIALAQGVRQPGPERLANAVAPPPDAELPGPRRQRGSFVALPWHLRHPAPPLPALLARRVPRSTLRSPP